MAIFDLFSKRQKILRGEVPDIYVYDSIPQELRVQIVHIVRDAFGKDKFYYNTPSKPEAAYQFIHKSLCREYGIFALQNKHYSDEENVLNFLLQTKDTEKAIDSIEFLFKYIDKIIKPDLEQYTYNTEIEMLPDEAIKELNDRFKEHGIGYQFEEGELIKVDSTYIHSEITKPTIALLNSKKFKGANEEYLKALDH